MQLTFGGSVKGRRVSGVWGRRALCKSLSPTPTRKKWDKNALSRKWLHTCIGCGANGVAVPVGFRFWLVYVCVFVCHPEFVAVNRCVRTYSSRVAPENEYRENACTQIMRGGIAGSLSFRRPPECRASQPTGLREWGIDG